MRAGPHPHPHALSLAEFAARSGRRRHTFSILTQDTGTVKYKDLISNLTFHEELDEVTGLSRKIIVDSPDEKKQPMIEMRDKAAKATRKYHMPSHAHLMVEDNESVSAGQVLAKIPRETTKTSACGCGERAERVEPPRAGVGPHEH
jgi:hypothetical protein